MGFSCFIIGDDTLVVRCAEQLIARDHRLIGIVSEHPMVSEWAHSNQIPILDSLASLEKAAFDEKIDYLFSISNHRILPQSILDLPTKGAINYHNAPLPRYGGVYATSWAILNGEKEHGITWHRMTKEVDKGAILIQRKVPIYPDDSSLALNIRCHDAASKTFPLLLDSLVGKVLTKAECSDLSAKSVSPTYYSLKNKVPGNAILSWDMSAEYIYDMYRALHMSKYRNQLGLPKILLGKTFYIPQNIEKMQGCSCQPVGTIIEIEDDALIVSTATTDIKITGFSVLHGQPISLTKILEAEDLHCGAQLSRATEMLSNNMEQYSAEHTQAERYWVGQLQKTLPAMLPQFQLKSGYFDLANEQLCEDDCLSASWKMPSKQADKLASSFSGAFQPDYILLAVIASYFGRLQGYHASSVGFSNALLRAWSAKMEGLLSPVVPLHIDFDLEEKSIFDVCRVLEERVNAINTFGAYEKDIFARYPALDAKEQLCPVCISLGEVSQEQYQYQSPFHINLDPKTHQITITLAHKAFLFENKKGDEKRFLRKKIQEIFLHLETMLDYVANNPSAAITGAPILTDDEIKKALCIAPVAESFNSRSNNLFHELPYIHQNFEKQVQKTPDVIAVAYNECEFSYQELNARANRLAHLLLKRDIGSGAIVAISLSNALDFITSVLGVLKTGATYVPIDTKLPENQIKFILDEVQPALLLSDKETKN